MIYEIWKAKFLGLLSWIYCVTSYFTLRSYISTKIDVPSVRHTSAVFLVTAVGMLEIKVGPAYVYIFINFLLQACKFSDLPGSWRHINLEHYTVQRHKRVSNFREMYWLHLQVEYNKFRLMHLNTFQSPEEGSSMFLRNVRNLHDFKKPRMKCF
jgi:hypothetical protein